MFGRLAKSAARLTMQAKSRAAESGVKYRIRSNPGPKGWVYANTPRPGKKWASVAAEIAVFSTVEQGIREISGKDVNGHPTGGEYKKSGGLKVSPASLVSNVAGVVINKVYDFLSYFKSEPGKSASAQALKIRTEFKSLKVTRMMLTSAEKSEIAKKDRIFTSASITKFMGAGYVNSQDAQMMRRAAINAPFQLAAPLSVVKFALHNVVSISPYWLHFFNVTEVELEWLIANAGTDPVEVRNLHLAMITPLPPDGLDG